MRTISLYCMLSLLFIPQLGGCDELFGNKQKEEQSNIATKNPQAVAQAVLDGYSTCLEPCFKNENSENLPTCQLNCEAAADVEQQKVVKANEEPGVEKVSPAQIKQTIDYLEGCFSSCNEDKKLKQATDRETCYLNCRSSHRIEIR